jgi:hypothetical protein
MSPLAAFTPGPGRKIWEWGVSLIMVYVGAVDKNPFLRGSLFAFLEELQTAIAPAFEENKVILYGEQDTGEIFKGEGLEANLVIISACAYCGVYNFVAEKFVREPQLCIRVGNRVAALVWLFQMGAEDEDDTTSILMLKLLLENGIDPNGSYKGHTEWGVILEEMADSITEDGRISRCFEGVKLLLRHGADFERQCSFSMGTGANKKSIEAKASELLKKWYDADQFAVLEDIVKRREAKKKKKKHGIAKKMGHLKLWMASKK